MKQEDQASKSRVLQFRIRTLLLIMLLVAAYFAGKMPEQRRARLAESKARAEMKRAMEAQRQAQIMANRSMEQADLALQQLQAAQTRLKTNGK